MTRSSHGIGPPGIETGSVEVQAARDGDRQQSIHERHPTLGDQQRILQCSARPGLAGGETEHGPCGDGRSGDPTGLRRGGDPVMSTTIDWAAMWRAGEMKAPPIRRSAQCRRCSSVPASSHNTTVLAPISARLSRPNPVSATDRDLWVARPRTTMPTTLPACVVRSRLTPVLKESLVGHRTSGHGVDRLMSSIRTVTTRWSYEREMPAAFRTRASTPTSRHALWLMPLRPP